MENPAGEEKGETAKKNHRLSKELPSGIFGYPDLNTQRSGSLFSYRLVPPAASAVVGVITLAVEIEKG